MAINNPRLKMQRQNPGADGWLDQLASKLLGSMRNPVTISMAEATRKAIALPWEPAHICTHTVPTITHHAMYKCRKRKTKGNCTVFTL